MITGIICGTIMNIKYNIKRNVTQGVISNKLATMLSTLFGMVYTLTLIFPNDEFSKFIQLNIENLSYVVLSLVSVLILIFKK